MRRDARVTGTFAVSRVVGFVGAVAFGGGDGSHGYLHSWRGWVACAVVTAVQFPVAMGATAA